MTRLYRTGTKAAIIMHQVGPASTSQCYLHYPEPARRSLPAPEAPEIAEGGRGFQLASFDVIIASNSDREPVVVTKTLSTPTQPHREGRLWIAERCEADRKRQANNMERDRRAAKREQSRALSQKADAAKPPDKKRRTQRRQKRKRRDSEASWEGIESTPRCRHPIYNVCSPSAG
jgi:hypothetical protein